MFTRHYHLEFVLQTKDARPEHLRSSLKGLVDVLDILPLEDTHGQGNNYKVQVKTKEPELVFDVCSEYGRLKSVKIEEEKGRM